ncbi:MAG: SH3 domain-containing protein [Caldilineaceae bacterium]|nr:SH3 domain-containing protein [Caldilineaceae bacterium]
MSGCVAASPFQGVAPAETGVSDALLSDISNFDFAPEESTEASDVTALVITEGSRANIRSGPGLDFPIVAKANPDDTFEVVGRSQDGEWWQICCVTPLDASGDAEDIPAWLAKVVIETEGDVDSVPVLQALLPRDLEADWKVDWQCGSERCEVKSCTADIQATVADTAQDAKFLSIDHNVEWDESCFSTDAWTFEVDEFTGQERSGIFNDNFLYNYWLGANPGEATDVFTLEDGRQVVVVCTGPHEIEIDEDDGWTTKYEGDTCYDLRTGMLVLLSYTKRWLFSGEYDGETYDKAYFGDYESLEQSLVGTNADLYYLPNPLNLFPMRFH